MRDVLVEKERLLEALTKNAKTHQADYDLAWEGFRKKAIENATSMIDSLRKAKKGRVLQLHVGLTPPENHIDDYNRAIEMLDWEERDTVMLSQPEFQCFVQDDWGWKGQFTASNAMYTGSKSPSTIG